MNVRAARYDVRMIETFDEARGAVQREMSLLVDDSRMLAVAVIGLEDDDGWMIEWGVVEKVIDNVSVIESPLPRAATFVDRLTGFVSLTSIEAERERIDRMHVVRVSVG